MMSGVKVYLRDLLAEIFGKCSSAKQAEYLESELLRTKDVVPGSVIRTGTAVTARLLITDVVGNHRGADIQKRQTGIANRAGRNANTKTRVDVKVSWAVPVTKNMNLRKRPYEKVRTAVVERSRQDPPRLECAPGHPEWATEYRDRLAAEGIHVVISGHVD